MHQHKETRMIASKDVSVAAIKATLSEQIPSQSIMSH
jgi:hypothetical protein